MKKPRQINNHKIEVRYNHNNSGGSWWLTDEDWFKLERAGWTVEWRDPDKKERWLGALASSASKCFHSPQEAILEWEQLLARRASDEGCSCCGPPHTFSWESAEDDIKHYGYASGSECLKYLCPDGYEEANDFRTALQAVEKLKEQVRQLNKQVSNKSEITKTRKRNSKRNSKTIR